jgi:hypothetical protein
MLPTPLLVDDRIRVFVGMLDSNGVGRIGWVDVDSADPTRVLAISMAPALDIGDAGSFDDNGVVPVSIVEHDGLVHLYYAGFHLGAEMPYTIFTGLAISEDGGKTFERVSAAPALGGSDTESCFRCGAHVQRIDGRWHMWYAGGGGWSEHDGKALPVYDLRHIESVDGLVWPSSGEVCIARAATERGFGRPAVLGLSQMWLSVRAVDGTYRMGYATSSDGGCAWSRNDAGAGIERSVNGWDSQMVAYPCLLRVGNELLLFYNGNGYGATGFGVARASPGAG